MTRYRALFALFLGSVASIMACAAPTDEGDDGEQVDSQEAHWDAQSVTNESESTHLWIVDRGIDILARHSDSDPIAGRALALMTNATCHAQWQQGLYDADFKAAYNNGRADLPPNPSDVQVGLAGATWASHFYDPDTGKNYKGEVAPTAYTEATSHLMLAQANHLSERKAKGCYELGLALHYFTDLTQPMHAANFTAVDRPAKLHSNLEGYSMELQERYPLDDWSGVPSGTTREFLVKTAKDSKPLFMEGVQAIVAAYKSYTGWRIAQCRNIDAAAWRFVERQHVDYRECWEGNPGVDALIGKTLQFAQERTAQYIYLVAKEIGGDDAVPAGTTADSP